MMFTKGMMLRLLHYLTWCYVIFLTLLLWLPDPKVVLYGLQPDASTAGYAHLMTFTVLGFLVELGRQKKSFWFWIGLLILYAFGTEIVQAATSPVYQMFHWNERTFGMDDLFQDVSGEAIGVTLGAVGRFFFKLKTENE